MKIAIGNDHAATDMKNEMVKYLTEKGHEVINVGTDTNESCNYPVFAKKCADLVVSGEAERGILICGTGIGMSIAANKIKGIRCALCSETTSASLTRAHNNANMLAMGARVIGIELAKDIVDTFLTTEFLGGRHQTRIDMISDLES